MEKETALLVADNLIGVYAGEHYNIPSNPGSHSLFKTLAKERGVSIDFDRIPEETFVQILRECADALTETNKEE